LPTFFLSLTLAPAGVGAAVMVEEADVALAVEVAETVEVPEAELFAFFFFSAAFLFFSALSFLRKADFAFILRIHFFRGFRVGLMQAAVAVVTTVVVFDGELVDVLVGA